MCNNDGTIEDWLEDHAVLDELMLYTWERVCKRIYFKYKALDESDATAVLFIILESLSTFWHENKKPLPLNKADFLIQTKYIINNRNVGRGLSFIDSKIINHISKLHTQEFKGATKKLYEKTQDIEDAKSFNKKVPRSKPTLINIFSHPSKIKGNHEISELHDEPNQYKAMIIKDHKEAVEILLTEFSKYKNGKYQECSKWLYLYFIHDDEYISREQWEEDNSIPSDSIKNCLAKLRRFWVQANKTNSEELQKVQQIFKDMNNAKK